MQNSRNQMFSSNVMFLSSVSKLSPKTPKSFLLSFSFLLFQKELVITHSLVKPRPCDVTEGTDMFPSPSKHFFHHIVLAFF